MASLGKRTREDTPGGPSDAPVAKKKFVLDENDIDFMIGDLTKEEAQLVLTRLLRKVSEETLRTQIEIVRHGRNQVTAEQIEKQMAQIKQLKELRNGLPSPMSPMFVPFGSPGMSRGDGEEFGSPYQPPAAAAGLSSGRLRAIKNRVRDSFKKRTNIPRKTHIVKLEVLDEDFTKVKDFAAKGNIQNALKMLEAITEEFADRVAETGQDNIHDIESILDQLGNHWLDLFLNDAYDLSEDDREDWYEKVRSWDTSASELGALTTAKWAAKFGWQDDGLKQILEGTGDVSEISFKEPQSLTVARLNILERDKKFQEAYNLASAVQLGLHASKFLMRMNRIEEAIASALKLSDSTKIYGIAQIARPINLSASFTLAIASMEKDWNNWNAERANWIVDLASVEKMLDVVVEQVSTSIKAKSVQYEMVKLLLSKRRPLESFALAQKILVPHDVKELTAIYNDLISRGIRASPVLAGEKLPEYNRTELLRLMPECDVPSRLPNWLWSNAMSTTQSAQNQIQIRDAGSNSGNLMQDSNTDYIDIALELEAKPQEIIAALLITENVDPLTLVMNSCVKEESYGDVNSLGSRCFDLILSQQVIDFEYRKQCISLEFKHAQKVVEATANGNVLPPFEVPPRDHPTYDFEDKKKKVCTIMLDAALKHKEFFKQQQEAAEAAKRQDNMETDQVAVIESEEDVANRLKCIEECNKVLQQVTDLAISKINNPDDLLDAAKRMGNREEYRLSLKIAHTSFNGVSKLVKQREELDIKFEEFTEVQQEINLLLSQKMKPSAEQIEKYRGLCLEQKYDTLLPPFSQHTVVQFIRKWYLIAYQILQTALRSKNSPEQAERMTDEEIQKEIEAVIPYVKHPNNIAGLVELFATQKEYTLIHFVGEKAFTAIKDIYEKFSSRVGTEVEIQLLLAEQMELQTAFGKDLGDAQKQKLESAKKTLEALPQKTYFELDSAEAFEQILWNILAQRMKAVLAQRKQLEAQIVSQSTSIDDNEEVLKQLNKELVHTESLIPSVLKTILGYVSSPFHLLELMKIIRSSCLNEIPSIAGRAFEIIATLSEASKATVIPAYDKMILKQEKTANMALPPKDRKPLPVENVDKLRELELQEQINLVMLPRYKSLSASKLEELLKQTVVLLVHSIQSRQSELFNELHRVRTEQIRAREELERSKATLSDTDLLVQKSAVESYSSQFTEISTELTGLVITMNNAIEQVLARISSPHTLSAVASLLASPTMDTFEFIDNKENLKHMKKLFLCIPPLVQKLEKERSERAATYEKLALLEQEKAELSALLKFPDEKTNELAEIRKQIHVWTSDLTHHNESADAYDSLIFSACSSLLKKFYSEYSLLLSQLAQVDSEQETAESIIANQSMDGSGDISMGESLRPEVLGEFTRRRNIIHGHMASLKAEIKSICDATLLYVINPSHLVEIASSLSPFATCSLQDMITLSSSAFPITKNLLAEYNRRIPILTELDGLEERQNELKCVDSKKSLQGKELLRLLQLRSTKYHWDAAASYLSWDFESLFQVNYNAANTILSTLLQEKASTQAQLNALRIKNLLPAEGESAAVVTNVEEIEELEKKLEDFTKQLATHSSICMEHLEDPKHYQDLINLVAGYPEYDLVISMGHVAQDLIKKHDDYRQELCALAREIFIYEAEEYVQTENREPLDDKRVKKKLALRKKFDTLPDLNYGVDMNRSTAAKGLPNSSTIEKPDDSCQLYNTSILDKTYRSNNIRTIFRSILSKLQSLEEKVEEENKLGLTPSKEEIENNRSAIQLEISTVMTYCFDHVTNPEHIKTMYSIAKSFGHHDLMMKIGEKYIERMAELRTVQEKKQPICREKAQLEILKKELLGQRKSLPKDEAERLRDLSFDAQLEDILPAYKRSSVSTYDDRIWSMFKAMLECSLVHKQELSTELDVMKDTPHLVRGKSSWTQDQILSYVADTNTSIQDELNMLIGLATTYVTNVDSLTSACVLLNSHKEYVELISMGKHAQGLLKEMVKLKIIFEEISKQLREERDKLPHTVQDNEETLQLAEQLEELELKVSPMSQSQLRHMILRIADLMIDAARMEKIYDVIRDQCILVFKMTLTVDKFEEVKTLVKAEDWDGIRLDLLEYVKNYNATLPGSAITLHDQMELLLREDLWREAVGLLPDAPIPSSTQFEKDTRDYIAMLELLWFEIERIDSAHLKILLPCIEEFAKKEFAQQRIDTIDRLLDGVQNFFPDFILPLYQSGSEAILAVGSNAKVYKQFCAFAAIAQRRLLESNQKKAWKTFITEVRQNNSRKKAFIKQLDVHNLAA